MTQPALTRSSGAAFSPCRRYRYILWRRFNPKPNPSLCCFVMLNPSTADENENDPTVERCERRARAMGYDGLVVLNCYAIRGTNPKILRQVQEPIGIENDLMIRMTAATAGIVICAWGQHAKYLGRGAAVEKILRDVRQPIYKLKLSKCGTYPVHPLYQPYALQPTEWAPRDATGSLP